MLYLMVCPLSLSKSPQEGPQGSILGPLLSLIYIDQLCALQLSESTSIQLYADDILLFSAFQTIDDIATFQNDINRVALAVDNLGLRLG